MLEIRSLIPPLGRQTPVEGELTAPKLGLQPFRHSLDLAGWLRPVLGQGASSLFVLKNGIPLARIPLGAPDESGRQEFCGRFSLFGAENEFELEVRLLDENLEATEVARIAGYRRPIASDDRFEHFGLITSSGRSGSSYLAHVLSQHPALAYYGPMRAEIRLAAPVIKSLRQRIHPKHIALHFNASSADQGAGDDILLAGDATLPPPEDLELWQRLTETSTEAAVSLARSTLKRLTQSAIAVCDDPEDAVLWLEKGSARWLSAVRSELLPGAREILLVRDVRDLLCSWLSYSPRKGLSLEPNPDSPEFLHFAHYQLECFEAYRRAAQSNDAALHVVRYEDLVRDPAATFLPIFRHLGVELTPAEVQALLNKADHSEATRQSRHKTSESADASIGRFRRELPPDLIARINQRAESGLRHFGYEL